MNRFRLFFVVPSVFEKRAIYFALVPMSRRRRNELGAKLIGEFVAVDDQLTRSGVLLKERGGRLVVVRRDAENEQRIRAGHVFGENLEEENHDDAIRCA